MIGTESGREWQPDGICSVGTGEQGPNLPVMRVGGIDVPDSVWVIGRGVQVSGIVDGLILEKPRTPPNEVREKAEVAFPAPQELQVNEYAGPNHGVG